MNPGVTTAIILLHITESLGVGHSYINQYKTATIIHIIEKVKVLVAQLCLTPCNPMGYIVRQAPLSVGSSKQEYWSGLPFPSPGNLPNPGNEPRSPAFQAGSLLPEPPGKHQLIEELWKQKRASEAGPWAQVGEEGRSVCSKGNSICRWHDEFEKLKVDLCGWNRQEASWVMWDVRGGAHHMGPWGPKSNKKPKADLRNKSRSLGKQKMLSIPSGHQN